MSDVATVAACQMAVEDLAVEANLAAVVDRVRSLDDRVDVALFPECTLTGFVADGRVHDAAIARDGSAVDRLRELAATEEVAVLVGFVEDAGERYNAAAYVHPDGDVTVYRKRNLWGGEREVLRAGERPVAVDSPVGRAGLVTCFDLNFVAVSAELTDERVDALFVVGAWPAAHDENWRLLCRARALDGVRHLVAVGRTGRRDVADARPAEYAGRSMAVRPDGSVSAALACGERDLLVDLDPAELAAHRRAIPVFEDGASTDGSTNEK